MLISFETELYRGECEGIAAVFARSSGSNRCQGIVQDLPCRAPKAIATDPCGTLSIGGMKERGVSLKQSRRQRVED
jgi:hypothetical protein